MSRQMESRGSDRQHQSINQVFSSKTGEQQITGEDFYDMVSDISRSMTDYCAKRPKAAALALISLGFFIGWKIKPW